MQQKGPHSIKTKKKSKFKQKTNYEFINLLSKDWVMS